MAVFRVERTQGYTVMSNYHLRDKSLSLKAKGLLSQMLSLPEDWDYTLAGSDFPHEVVRSRFLKLDSSHIEFVMDCLQKNTTEVRNMKPSQAYARSLPFPRSMMNCFLLLGNSQPSMGKSAAT